MNGEHDTKLKKTNSLWVCVWKREREGERERERERKRERERERERESEINMATNDRMQICIISVINLCCSIVYLYLLFPCKHNLWLL